MRLIPLAATLASVLVSTAAFAQAPSVFEKEFVMKASVGNTFEIKESKLALLHATDARLKRYAEKMISHPQHAEKKLQTAGANDRL